jgi:hypothetical protein
MPVSMVMFRFVISPATIAKLLGKELEQPSQLQVGEIVSALKLPVGSSREYEPFACSGAAKAIIGQGFVAPQS